MMLGTLISPTVLRTKSQEENAAGAILVLSLVKPEMPLHWLSSDHKCMAVQDEHRDIFVYVLFFIFLARYLGLIMIRSSLLFALHWGTILSYQNSEDQTRIDPWPWNHLKNSNKSDLEPEILKELKHLLNTVLVYEHIQKWLVSTEPQWNPEHSWEWPRKKQDIIDISENNIF